MKKEVVISGAGLVGSLLAVYLVRRGYKVSIYERRPDMRKEEISAGRSINLALSDRGLLALEKVGLAEEIRQLSIPMFGRFIHNADSSTAFQAYGKEGQFINAVSRGELNKKLMGLAEASGVKINFNHKCDRINWRSREVSFEVVDDGTYVSRKFDLLFGADGAYSATRLQHQLQHDRFDYHQFYINCGYKELSIPPLPGGGSALEKNALHIWPRKDYMLIALPNPDGSFTCTLFFPFEGETSFSSLQTDDKILGFFQNNFGDAVPLMPDLIREFKTNPVSSLVTVKCFPWTREDYFSLIGDAAHAIVPFFGQGMNCGFEDCRILDQLMDTFGDDWSLILPHFQSLRKPDADAIADMAIGNFTEMREKVADPLFLLQKRIEARLHEKYPEKWIPAYSQVTFNPHIRYSEALRNAQKQDRIMQEVMSMPGIETRWDSREVEHLVLSKL